MRFNVDVHQAVFSTSSQCPPARLKKQMTGKLHRLDYYRDYLLNAHVSRHITRYTSGVVSKCLSQFSDPLSPHLAAKDGVDQRKACPQTFYQGVRNTINSF